MNTEFDMTKMIQPSDLNLSASEYTNKNLVVKVDEKFIKEKSSKVYKSIVEKEGSPSLYDAIIPSLPRGESTDFYLGYLSAIEFLSKNVLVMQGYIPVSILNAIYLIMTSEAATEYNNVKEKLEL